MRSVLVIGGGWAGISAAMSAAQRGCKVHLVEERPYLGGRVRSFLDKRTDEEIDNGQHLLMGCYHETRKILQALGTDHLVEIQRALTVPFVDRNGVNALDGGGLPGSLGVALGIVRLGGLSTRSKLMILRLAARLRLGKPQTKGHTCETYLLSEGQTKEAIERFWEPIILATLNSPVALARAELLVTVMQLAFLGSGDDSKLMFPRAGLSQLIDPFPSWLASHDGTMHTSTRCEALDFKDGRAVRARLSNGSQIDVDEVISAIPQVALRRLGGDTFSVPTEWEADASPIVSVYLWYNKAWMRSPFAATLGTTIQWVFNRRMILDQRLNPGAAEYDGHVSLTVSAGAELAKADTQEIIEGADAELRTLFPEMTSAKLTHGLVIKEKRATPLITPTVVRPTSGALNGVVENLWLAGDWTDTGLPATIEGAAVSGVRAVEAMFDPTRNSRVS